MRKKKAMIKNTKHLIGAVIAGVMLCGMNGCSLKSGESIEQNVTGTEDIQTEEEDSFSGIEEAVSNEEQKDAEKEASGEDLDVAEPNAADDDWYMKGNIYTDENGNRLEVFFNDYGTLEFSVNGLSLYFTTVESFQQENDWKIYTCDDGTMIIFYPGEPEHLEISDGDYAGLYEAGGDKMS